MAKSQRAIRGCLLDFHRNCWYDISSPPPPHNKYTHPISYPEDYITTFTHFSISTFVSDYELILSQGATKSAINLYTQMTASLSFQSPLSWSSPDFSLLTYDLVFLPGGHDKGVRQIIDSPAIKRLLVSYFPLTKKGSGSGGKKESEPAGKKVLAAVCHGVMVLSEALVLEGEDKGKSVMRECTTTALPAVFEGVAYQGTRLWLGDYYLTYGRGSDSVETAVRQVPPIRLENICVHTMESCELILVFGMYRSRRDWMIRVSSGNVA